MAAQVPGLFAASAGAPSACVDVLIKPELRTALEPSEAAHSTLILNDLPGKRGQLLTNPAPDTAGV